MCWKLAIQVLLLISLTLSNSSEAIHAKNLHSSAVIVGRVLCNTCFQDDFSSSTSSRFISGATVSVECKESSFKKEATTNNQGKFKVHLPFPISKHEKKIKGCQVILIQSNDPYCTIASSAISSSIYLKSRKQGVHVFSAGFFTFKPLKQPDLCNQQQSSKEEAIARPQFLFPPIVPPVFPSPPPAIGGIPLPPNPLQPAPLVPLPPNPLQPPSPPSFGLPGIPGLPGFTPSPPPPAPVLPLPPGLSIPPVVPGLPGLPVPPVIPGVPSLPGLPVPPVVPGVPSLPGLPVPPVVPGVPGLPGLPVPPVGPGVPSLPLPLPPGLPIPPVIPGVPPAKKVSP